MIFMDKVTDQKGLMDSYALMMKLPAWMDFEEMLRKEVMESVKREDSKAARDLTLTEVGEERGYRKAINKMLKHASQRREGI